MSVEMNNTAESEENFTVDLEESVSQQPAPEEKPE